MATSTKNIDKKMQKCQRLAKMGEESYKEMIKSGTNGLNVAKKSGNNEEKQQKRSRI